MRLGPRRYIPLISRYVLARVVGALNDLNVLGEMILLCCNVAGPKLLSARDIH
jgi:hypothetical protein